MKPRGHGLARKEAPQRRLLFSGCEAGRRHDLSILGVDGDAIGRDSTFALSLQIELISRNAHIGRVEEAFVLPRMTAY